MPNSTTNPPIEIRLRPSGLGSWWPTAASSTGSGTNKQAANDTTLYYVSIVVPGSCFISGISYLAGATSTGSTVKASLHSLDGTLLGVSAATTTPTASTVLNLPLTTGYDLTGPAIVLVALTFATTDKFCAIPAYVHNGSYAGSVTVVANTPATFTPSSTKFTADMGPVAFLT